MDIKLLAFDLDGTALMSHRELSEKNRAALEAAGKYGVILVPSTGRIRGFLPKSISDISAVNYAITSNGAAVVNIRNGECLHGAYIRNETAVKVQKILNAYDVYVEYYFNGEAYTLKGNPEKAMNDTEFPKSKHHFLSKKYIYVDDLNDFVSSPGITPEKINMPYLPEGVRARLIEEIGRLEGLHLTSSIPDNLEVNGAAGTKGQALEWLCGHLGVSREECMAIGDNGNDADMLRYAGISVAMGNSSAEAFEAAKYTTASCEQDGFADAVERFILI